MPNGRLLTAGIACKLFQTPKRGVTSDATLRALDLRGDAGIIGTPQFRHKH
jgi:hypothetical protein